MVDLTSAQVTALGASNFRAVNNPSLGTAATTTYVGGATVTSGTSAGSPTHDTNGSRAHFPASSVSRCQRGGRDCRAASTTAAVTLLLRSQGHDLQLPDKAGSGDASQFPGPILFDQ